MILAKLGRTTLLLDCCNQLRSRWAYAYTEGYSASIKLCLLRPEPASCFRVGPTTSTMTMPVASGGNPMVVPAIILVVLQVIVCIVVVHWDEI